MDWIQFSSEEELHNILLQENHATDEVKLHVQAQKPKYLQGDQASDENKDFWDHHCLLTKVNKT